MKSRLHLTLASLILLTVAGAAALAQHGHQDANQPKHHDEAAAPAKADQRVGDPYALDTCPITGKKLGSMGDPIVKVYDGREVRYCCGGCPGSFEKDLAASFIKLDEKIVKDQLPLYPLKTSVVTGKELPAKPFEFVYGNRLVRLGAESEKAEFLKDPKSNLATLDKAVIAAQGKDYSIKTCPVSNESLGGDGEVKDVVIAGRLIRLCCNDCKKELDKNPSKFVAMVDAARSGKVAPDADHKEKHQDKKPG